MCSGVVHTSLLIISVKFYGSSYCTIQLTDYHFLSMRPYQWHGTLKITRALYEHVPHTPHPISCTHKLIHV